MFHVDWYNLGNNFGLVDVFHSRIVLFNHDQIQMLWSYCLKLWFCYRVCSLTFMLSNRINEWWFLKGYTRPVIVFLHLLLYDLKEYNHHGYRIVWQCATVSKPIQQYCIKSFPHICWQLKKKCRTKNILWSIVMILNRLGVWSQNYH